MNESFLFVQVNMLISNNQSFPQIRLNLLFADIFFFLKRGERRLGKRRRGERKRNACLSFMHRWPNRPVQHDMTRYARKHVWHKHDPRRSVYKRFVSCQPVCLALRPKHDPFRPDGLFFYCFRLFLIFLGLCLK